MAKYRVRDNSTGQVHTIDGPDDASPDEIEGAAQAIFGGAQRVQDDRGAPTPGTMGPQKRGGTGGGLAKIPTTPNDVVYDPTSGMSTGQKFAAGVGEAMTNAARGIVGALPGVDNSADVAEARRLDAPLNATGAGAAGNLTGTAAAVLAPGGVAKLAGMGARALGAGSAADALSLTGDALLAPKGVLPGGAVGGVTGAVQPAASTSERVQNVLGGAAAGAAIPLVSRGVKAGMSAIEPFYEGGQQRILGRAMNNAAGSDAPNVAARLEAGTQPFVGPQVGVPRGTVGELVPGSIPTTSQLAQSPSLSALEQASMASNPEVKNRITAQLADQNTARRGVISDIAGSDADKAAAIADREAASHPAYDLAFTSPLDPKRVAAMQGRFDSLSANPWIQDAVPAARKLAAGDGVTLDAGSVQGMHYLKLALDDAIAKGASPTSALGKNQLRQMTSAQRDLVDAMGQVSPEYDSARAWHKTLSQPINEQQVAQRIEDQSVDKLTGNIRPGNFARALDDSTAAKATGYPGATLESTLSNTSENRLRAILEDLQRADRSTRQGRGIGSDTAQKLAYANMVEQAGVPTWLGKVPVIGQGLQVAGNLAGRAAQPLYGGANNRLQQMLAEALSDPSQVASLMRQAGPRSADWPEWLRRVAQPALTASPALLNAGQ